MLARILAMHVLLLAGSCTQNAPTPSAVNLTADPHANVLSPSNADATPNYSEREGDTYMYVSAVSEEDRQKGRATGDVVMYRYLGFKGGKHLLASVDESGTITGRNECSDPCRIIKSTYGEVVQRIPYNESSVIGSAFADALAGRLEVSKKGAPKLDASPTEERKSAEIPAVFQGEWNADLSACGTGLNDSRLRISATKLQFYESIGIVESIKVENSRVINVTASFSGEGQTWRKTTRFALTGPGNGISVDSDPFLRRRCPA